eukprot:scaffold3.g6727.t1
MGAATATDLEANASSSLTVYEQALLPFGCSGLDPEELPGAKLTTWGPIDSPGGWSTAPAAATAAAGGQGLDLIFPSQPLSELLLSPSVDSLSQLGGLTTTPAVSSHWLEAGQEQQWLAQQTATEREQQWLAEIWRAFEADRAGQSAAVDKWGARAGPRLRALFEERGGAAAEASVLLPPGACGDSEGACCVPIVYERRGGKESEPKDEPLVVLPDDRRVGGVFSVAAEVNNNFKGAVLARRFSNKIGATREFVERWWDGRDLAIITTGGVERVVVAWIDGLPVCAGLAWVAEEAAQWMPAEEVQRLRQQG